MNEDIQSEESTKALPIDSDAHVIGDLFDRATDDSEIAKVFREAKEELHPKVEEFTEEEKTAMESGWTRDKEAFEKKTGKTWKTAKEYNHDGSYYKKIDSQNQEIKELKAAMKKQADHLKQAEAKAFEKAMAVLNSQKLEAVQAGNINKYKDIEQQIQEKQQEYQTVEEVPPQEAVEFAEKNKEWFNREPENEALVAEAVKAENYWLNKKPELSMKERMELVEGDVKRAFPERFAVTKSRRDEPSAVALKTERSSAKRSTLADRMNDQQKALARAFVKDGLYKSHEEYAQDLEKQGTLRHE